MEPRRHLTFANLASATALVVALTGSGVAVAGTLGANTVGSPQIRNGSVKRVDLAADAVTGNKVAPDSLTGADVRESTLALPAAARVYAGDAENHTRLLTASYAPYASVSATAPAPGFFVIIAESTLDPAEDGTYVPALVTVDGEFGGSESWDPGEATGLYQSQSMTLTVPVTEGTHTVVLNLLESGVVSTFGNAYESHVTVLYVPSGRAGTTPYFD